MSCHISFDNNTRQKSFTNFYDTLLKYFRVETHLTHQHTTPVNVGGYLYTFFFPEQTPSWWEWWNERRKEWKMFQFFNYSTCHLTRNSQKTLSMFSIRIINYLLSSFIFFLILLRVRSTQKNTTRRGEQRKRKKWQKCEKECRGGILMTPSVVYPRNEMRVTWIRLLFVVVVCNVWKLISSLFY